MMQCSDFCWFCFSYHSTYLFIAKVIFRSCSVSNLNIYLHIGTVVQFRRRCLYHLNFVIRAQNKFKLIAGAYQLIKLIIYYIYLWMYLLSLMYCVSLTPEFSLWMLAACEITFVLKALVFWLRCLQYTNYYGRGMRCVSELQSKSLQLTHVSLK